MEILTRLTGLRPVGFRAPWFEINPWTPTLLARHQINYCASEMGDDVPYFHENGLVEIPGQWLLEDWEQFAFNADPAWGFVLENCEKVFDLWWREFDAMHDLGCCFVLTLHPWLSGRPSRMRLLEDLVTAMQEKGRVWFARGNEIASYFQKHPEVRREIDFDNEAVGISATVNMAKKRGARPPRAQFSAPSRKTSRPLNHAKAFRRPYALDVGREGAPDNARGGRGPQTLKKISK
jgi:hypothetical protein